MTILQDILAALGWQTRVTENFRSVAPSGLYGINPATTSGLTLGYLGGAFNGVDVSNGTVLLAASATNYVVAHRTTGAVTASTGTTNWLDTSTYVQLYQLVAGTSSFTIASTSDKRQSFGWLPAGAATVGGANKQIQYNNAGAFGAEAGFEYDQATNTMTVVNATFAGLALTAASATGGAGLRVPPGAAPTSPVDGDVWTTSAGVFARINGATVGPFASSSGLSTLGKQSIPIMAAGIRPSASGGCASLATTASGANLPDITTLNFDAATEEYAQFAIPMPKKWNEGTITANFIWSHAATTTNFGVVWGLQAVAVSDDDTIAAAFGTAQTVTDTGGTTDDLYITSETSTITVGGTPQASDMVYFRVYRKAADASDTMAIDARLHAVVVFITTDAGTDA